MFPDQQNQNGGQPQYGPPPVPQPPTQYPAVPPIQAASNNGHSGHNPYEFIVAPQTARSSGLFGGNDFVKKIILLAGGAVVLMIVAAVAISALAPKKDNSTSLSAIAETQQEIVRVAAKGAQASDSQSTQNFATNVELSVQSNQGQLLAYLTKHGTKLGPKQLALKRSLQTDTLLSNATATNTFDTAVTSSLSTQLTDYASTLRTAYKQAANGAEQQLLQQSYTAAEMLLIQSKSVQAGS